MVRLQVYLEKPKAGSTRSPGWRWRLKAVNGRIVADGSEAYVKRTGAERAARLTVELFRGRLVFKTGETDGGGCEVTRVIEAAGHGGTSAE
jgi:uncharacterized protein YegP (UPF0339 family)